MKKLLNILASITLVSTASITAVACSNNEMAPPREPEVINPVGGREIADKIKNKNIILQAGTDKELNNSNTIEALKTAIKKANPSLTTDELARLSFADDKPLIVDGSERALTVKTTILDQDGTKRTGNAFVDIKVSVNATAAQIKAKITNPSSTIIGIPTGSSTDLSTPATQKAIKDALQDKYNLTNHDISTISFPDTSPTLQTAEQDNAVKLLITDDSVTNATANLTLAKVQIHRSASEIKRLITASNLIAIRAGSNTSLSTPATQKAIKDALQAEFTKISDYDLTTITFPNTSTPLTDNETINSVDLRITDDASSNATDNVTLDNVQIHRTAKQIEDKITDPTTTVIAIKAKSNTNLANSVTKTELKNAIKNKYGLSDQDISNITFPNASRVTLKNNEQDNPVTIDITDDNVPTGDETITLDKVQIHSDAAQIAAKITNPASIIGLPTGTGTSLSSNTVQKAIKDKLASKYGLSTNDLAQISFPNAQTRASLNGNEQDNRVVLSIKDDSGSASPETVILDKVRINRSASDIAGLITNPSTTIIAIPANSDVRLDNDGTITAIKTALQTEYTTLTKHDLAMISFDSSDTLNASEADNSVVLTITDESKPSPAPTVTLSKVRINRTALEIKNIIDGKKDNPLYLPSNANTSMDNPNTRASLKTELKKAAPDLTDYDLTTITNYRVTAGAAGGVLKVQEQDNSVELTLQDDASPQGTQNVTLSKVNINRTAQQIFNTLNAVLTDGVAQISISGASTQSTTDQPTRTAILNVIKARVPSITQNDIDNFIKVDPGKQIQAVATLVGFTIKDDQGDTRSYSLNIKTS